MIRITYICRIKQRRKQAAILLSTNYKTIIEEEIDIDT